MTAAAIIERVNRAAVALGLGALASGLFAAADHIQYRLVRLSGAGLVVLLVFAAVAVVGGRLARRLVVACAGAGFLVAAVVQLVQLGGGTNWLRGDGSTFSLFLGFAVGLLVLGLTPIPSLPDTALMDTAKTDEGVPGA
jgi:hypothetical protein